MQLMEAIPVHVRPPKVTEINGVNYSLLDETVAQEMKKEIKERYLNLVGSFTALAGGVITLASPLVITKIRDLGIGWLSWIATIGFLIIAGSLALGIGGYLTEVRVRQLNPHFYFLEGGGKRIKKETYECLLRLASGDKRSHEDLRVSEQDFKRIEAKKSKLEKTSAGLLLFHNWVFGIGLIVTCVSIVIYVIKY